MRPNDSFHEEKPAYYRQSNQATAVKSPSRARIDQTQLYTPTRFQRKASQRRSQLKDSINKCIQSLSNKRQLNRQALQQVQGVNREIILSLSSGRQEQRPFDDYNQPQHRTDYRPPRYNDRDEKERDNVTLSSFNLAPVDNIYRHSNFQTSQVYRPQSTFSSQLEVQEIRLKINNSRSQNQYLQRQVQALYQENQVLLSIQSNPVTQEHTYLISENARLRDELNRVNQSLNVTEMHEHLQKLKQENEIQRKQTIEMLKNARH